MKAAQSDLFATYREPTGRRCHCGGEIVTISRVDQDYLACSACGTTSRFGGKRQQKQRKPIKVSGFTMPRSHIYLMEHGHLSASEAEALGEPNARCMHCEERTDLLWLNPIIPSVKDFEGVLPGSVWGEDIAVLCRCCSMQDCRHCLWRGEMVIGHDYGMNGLCQRCGRSATAGIPRSWTCGGPAPPSTPSEAR